MPTLGMCALALCPHDHAIQRCSSHGTCRPPENRHCRVRMLQGDPPLIQHVSVQPDGIKPANSCLQRLSQTGCRFVAPKGASMSVFRQLPLIMPSTPPLVVAVEHQRPPVIRACLFPEQREQDVREDAVSGAFFRSTALWALKSGRCTRSIASGGGHP
jgi:hypothetical protein